MADENIVDTSRSVTREETHALREAGLKRCFDCGRVKEHSCFGNEVGRWDGLSPRCRECITERRRKRTERDPDWQKRQSAKNRAKNGDKLNADARARYRVDIEHARELGRSKRTKRPEIYRASGERYREKNREKSNEASKLAKRAARAISREADKAYRAANKDRRAAVKAAYVAANIEKVKAGRAAYAKANAGKVNANTARRTAAKLLSIPPWADKSKIAELYADAARLTAETGIRHEVDHIVPLQSKWVCGLHCGANLQVIPRGLNRSKCNRYWPGMFELDTPRLALAA